MTKLETEINSIRIQIIDKYKPDRIILFGSAVSGKISYDSDLDFCIIKRKLPANILERSRNLRKMINKNIACDFFIFEPGEIDKRLKLKDPFIMEIYKKGKILYDRTKNLS